MFATQCGVVVRVLDQDIEGRARFKFLEFEPGSDFGPVTLAQPNLPYRVAVKMATPQPLSIRGGILPLNLKPHSAIVVNTQ